MYVLIVFTGIGLVEGCCECGMVPSNPVGLVLIFS